MTPSAAGTESVQLVIAGYDNNKMPVPTLSAQAQGVGAGDVSVLITQLPQSQYIGAAGNFRFLFRIILVPRLALFQLM